MTHILGRFGVKGIPNPYRWELNSNALYQNSLCIPSDSSVPLLGIYPATACVPAFALALWSAFACAFKMYFACIKENTQVTWMSIDRGLVKNGDHCKDPKFGPSFQGGKTARPNKPAQQMQHARGFIDGCTNRVILISWEAEHTEQ